jgi:hypothetical protein
MALRKRLQYQVKTEPVLVPAPSGTGVGFPDGSVTGVPSRITFQYQAQAYTPFIPPTEVITEDKWHFPWATPTRPRIAAAAAIALIASGLFQTPFVAPAAAGTGIVTPVTDSVGIQFKERRQYQALAYVPFVATETVTVDKWVYPWTEPVRKRAGLIAAAQQVFTADTAAIPVSQLEPWFQPLSEPVRQKPGLRASLQPVQPAPVLDNDTQIIQTFESRWHYAWSEPVRTRRFQTAQQQSAAFIGPSEIVTVDKWVYPWTDPVRQKPGLRASLQQSLTATTLDPDTQLTNGFESRWHYAWSEPVRFNRLATAQQPFYAAPATAVFESITVDKWIYPWTEPVRQKPGLKAGLQQAFTATTLNPDTQIINGFESRWHYAWSEPVRFRRLATAQQVSHTEPPTSVFEVVTIDKWFAQWREPVRQKPGLGTSLQQAYADPAFVAATPQPGTGIVTPVTDSVGVQFRERRQYQALAYSPFFTAETITPDKWAYPWSEPVRQKPGIRAALQQAFIATTLNPETQIINGFESRWHYPWSEPVRTRRLAVAQYPFITQPTTSVFETVTVDKWTYPWSEPVRQKPGQRASLQQDFIGTVLEPNTQIIQGYESRWHYPWSEPVRLRLFPAAEQLAFVFQPPSFEVVTVDKWVYPWLEPVRTRLFPAAQQQVYASAPFVAETITADKWLYPWSEPVKVRRWLPAGQQQFFTADTATIPLSTLQPWFSPLSEPVRVRLALRAGLQQFAPQVFSPPIVSFAYYSGLTEPVRQKPGLKAYLQQALIAPVLNPETQLTGFFESRWHYAWSEPVRFRRLAVAQQVSHTEPPTSRFEIVTVDKWIYPWRDPVRQKIWLRTGLHQALIATTLDPNTQLTKFFESRWHYAWSEPVRQKPGLRGYLHPFLTNAFLVRPFDITGVMHGTEQGDLFSAFGSTFTQVGSALVGIQFDRPAASALVGIQFDMPRDSAKVGSIETTASPTPGSVSSPIFSANVSIRKV